MTWTPAAFKLRDQRGSHGVEIADQHVRPNISIRQPMSAGIRGDDKVDTIEHGDIRVRGLPAGDHDRSHVGAPFIVLSVPRTTSGAPHWRRAAARLTD